MKIKKTRRHKKRSSNPRTGLGRRLRQFFKRLFRRDQVPKAYRPYLGPDASPEEIEKQKYENTRVNLRKYYKRQKKVNQQHEVGRDESRWYLLPKKWKRRKPGKKSRKIESMNNSKSLSV